MPYHRTGVKDSHSALGWDMIGRALIRHTGEGRRCNAGPYGPSRALGETGLGGSKCSAGAGQQDLTGEMHDYGRSAGTRRAKSVNRERNKMPIKAWEVSIGS